MSDGTTRETRDIERRYEVECIAAHKRLNTLIGSTSVKFTDLANDVEQYIKTLQTKLDNKEPKETGHYCNKCKTRIWSNEPRISYPDGKWMHSICAVTRRAEQAEQERDELKRQLQYRVKDPAQPMLMNFEYVGMDHCYRPVNGFHIYSKAYTGTQEL